METAGAENAKAYPTGWERVFEQIGPSSSLRTPIANFGVKFRLVNEFRSSAFAGDSSSSDAYYVMLKTSLLYSAIEAWQIIVGTNRMDFSSSQLASELRANPKWTNLRRKLFGSLTSKKLLAKLDKFSAGESDDLLPVVAAIRHGFFHPELTAENSALSNNHLRRTIMRVLEMVRDELSASFASYADEIEAWNKMLQLFRKGELDEEEVFLKANQMSVIAGHTRDSLKHQFNQEINDKRWAMIIEYVMLESDVTPEETVIEVASHIREYEEDLDFLEEHGPKSLFTSLIQNSKKQD